MKTIDGVEVVPNRSLKSYLVDDVSRRAQSRSVQLQQLPDAILECSDNTYIGHAVRNDGPPARPLQARATVADLTNTRLGQDGLAFLSTEHRWFSNGDLRNVDDRTGYKAARLSLIFQTELPSDKIKTGFAVHGARIKHAVSSAGMSAEILDPGNRSPTIIRLTPSGRPVTSVLLVFDDGGATVVAAFKGYIGVVTVERGLVVNVDYMSSSSGFLADARVRVRDEQLCATVSSAVRFGTFRIEGSSNERSAKAAQLAKRIRPSKVINPTLGLYATYAYANAGIIEQIESTHSFMRSDLEANVFDVAMLAGLLTEPQDGRTITVPFCPMLSQGWEWLRVRNVTLPANVTRMRDFLRPALWTTFGSGALPSLENEIASR